MATPTFDFTGATMPSGASVTRSSVGTRFNASGVMETISANLPRFDYDPVSHAFKGLMLETSAINLALYSEQLDNAAWQKSGVSVTTDIDTSPTGATTADRLMGDGANNTHYVLPNPNILISGPMTYSVFLKQGSERYAYLFLMGRSPTYDLGIIAYVDLQTGSVTQPGITGYTAGIQNAGNGWYRVCIIGSITWPSSTLSEIRIAVTSLAGLQASMASGYIRPWGVQVEAGTVATSYMLTTSTAFTRTLESLVLNWATLGIVDGACYSRITYDDLSTGIVAGTVASGSQTIGAALLTRAWVRKVEYLMVPTTPAKRGLTLSDNFA